MRLMHLRLREEALIGRHNRQAHSVSKRQHTGLDGFLYRKTEPIELHNEIVAKRFMQSRQPCFSLLLLSFRQHLIERTARAACQQEKSLTPLTQHIERNGGIRRVAFKKPCGGQELKVR